jgi:hypothetical protein
MSSARHKTLRKSDGETPTDGDTGGSAGATDYSRNDSLDQILTAEAGTAFKKPWHRLERGLRLNRLRAFSESMAAARGLKAGEKTALLEVLTRALDRKVLNSKLAVVYDPEKEEITEIKPLVMHQNATGEVLFKILERKNAVTFRKKPAAVATTAAQEQ